MSLLPPALQAKAFAKVTPRLLLVCLFMSLGNIIFGYDEQYFGAVNAMPAYVKQFGELKNGVYVLSPSRVSFITSIAYVGKFIGCFVAGPSLGRFGHRKCMFAMSIISMIAVVIQMTSTHYVQYGVGRIVLFFGVALAENAVSTYLAEIVPGPARGAFISTLVFFNGFGGVISAIVVQVESPKLSKSAWLWPTGVAGIFPFLVFCGIWFVPDSPRWLISRGRSEEAIKVLRAVRPKADVAAGHCEAEVAAIEEFLAGQVEKGPWIELFQPGNRRRTLLAVIPMNFAQFTGIAFVASYGVIFYQQKGLGAGAFSYRLITACSNLLACFLACLFLVDQVGRRPMYIAGSLLQTLFLYLEAGIGLMENPSNNTKHFFVACVMLVQIVYSSIFAPIPYVYAAEVGTPRMREKTFAFAAATNVFSAWFISFILPYLLDAPYAHLESNVGWIFGTIAIFSAVFGYFFLPETKGRALEEINACFEEGISARQFDKFISTGAAGRIAGYEVTGSLHADDAEAQRKLEAMQLDEMAGKHAVEETDQSEQLRGMASLA